MHVFLDEITETRTSCGFRENMIREANKPCDAVALGWLVCGHLESLIQDVIALQSFEQYKKNVRDLYLFETMLALDVL